ncbi:MAG: SDR family oxidoreductase [Bacillota bacterium]
MSYPSYPYIGSMTRCEEVPVAFPPQHQDCIPGLEWPMVPPPIFDNPHYRPAGKLAGRVALITGGDSGIGRAVAVAFAKEGAAVAFAYYDEHRDAAETRGYIERLGGRCLALPADLRQESAARHVVAETARAFGPVDILVNNIAVAFPSQQIEAITPEQLAATFQTNVFSYFYMTKAALPHMRPGSAIINTVSDAAYTGLETRLDYAASKGATVAFTRSLAKALVERGIRVNGLSPGPVWTPLIPPSIPAGNVPAFGTETPLGRAAQPFELAPAYVYLASDDARYVTGQVIHVNGGAPVVS